MPEVIINGPEGRLEGRYHHSSQANAPIALVLHPHPQYGGTMNNKVVYNVFRLFTARGFSVLRFNFRGVGRSEGTYDRGEGELSDAAASLDWMQSFNADAPTCWIAGFSFGALISMQLLMRRPEIAGFISIAPPANKYDFSFLAPCPASGLVIQGDRDEQIPQADVIKFVERLNQQKSITIEHKVVAGANHFFTDHMEELVSEIGSYVDKSMGVKPRIAARA